MTLNPIIIDEETTLKDAAEKMLFVSSGAMPVGSSDKLVGMITDRDITVRAVSMGKDPVKTTVGDVMTRGVFFIDENDDLDLAAEIFRKQKINRLVVKDSRGRLVGILSLGNMIRHTKDTGALTRFIQKLANNNHHRKAV